MSGLKVALWGSAGHAKVLADLVALRGGQVVALFDNSDVPSVVAGVPIYLGEEGFDRWVRAEPRAGEIAAFVAIGGARGLERITIQSRMQARGLNLTTLVHPKAVVAATAVLGVGTQVLAHALVAAGARVGAACIVNHRASIDHECTVGDGVHLAPASTLCGCVTLGRNVMIGAGAVVLPRVSIGEDAIVGAGSVVTRDVPAGFIVVGNPARMLRAVSTDNEPL